MCRHGEEVWQRERQSDAETALLQGDQGSEKDKGREE